VGALLASALPAPTNARTFCPRPPGIRARASTGARVQAASGGQPTTLSHGLDLQFARISLVCARRAALTVNERENNWPKDCLSRPACPLPPARPPASCWPGRATSGARGAQRAGEVSLASEWPMTQPALPGPAADLAACARKFSSLAAGKHKPKPLLLAGAFCVIYGKSIEMSSRPVAVAPLAAARCAAGSAR